MNKQLKVSERTSLLNTYATIAISHVLLDYLDTGDFSMYKVRKQIQGAARQLGISSATATRTIHRIADPFIELVSMQQDLRANAKATVALYKPENQQYIINTLVKSEQELTTEITTRVNEVVTHLEHSPLVLLKLEDYVTQDIL